PYMCAKVMIGGNCAGELFRIHPQLEEAFDLGHTYVCEVDMKQLPYGLIQAKPYSKYQSSIRDLSILIPKSLTYEAIKSVIAKHASAEVKRFYPVDRYASQSLGDHVSLSLRFVLQSEEKTLEEEEITASIEWILTGLKEELGVNLR
ncbi:MAG: phenylalanyl-tRNA synthetase beta chain, partial [Campylobacterota bacterium]|nr:phenylalanyl-tRNA synthetase beta chain [Campylobacterota bacterium]